MKRKAMRSCQSGVVPTDGSRGGQRGRGKRVIKLHLHEREPQSITTKDTKKKAARPIYAVENLVGLIDTVQKKNSSDNE